MIQTNNSVGIIPIFVSHMGCPNACTFCNQRKINGVEDAIKPEALVQHVEAYLKTMKRDRIELAFFGGSFTGIPIALQESYLFYAKQLKSMGRIDAIRLSTRPDYVDETVINRLVKFEVDLVELGCQSFDETVLNAAKRGHDKQAIYRAVELLNNASIKVGIQLMLGLSFDSEEKFMASVEEAVSLRPDCVRLYPALVIKDTELFEHYERGVFSPLTLDEAVVWCAKALMRFNKAEIQVIRIGLQPTDVINFDGSVVAGPFHPAFGALVMSQLHLNVLETFFKQIFREMLWSEDKDVKIMVNEKHVSAIKGNRRINEQKLNALVFPNGKQKISVIGDNGIELGVATVSISNRTYKVNIMS